MPLWSWISLAILTNKINNNKHALFLGFDYVLRRYIKGPNSTQ